ncbi:fibroleukin [Drosophila gunungcola]|uniref:fibroleukin n=1 Tax=Drosophila gunungcola TaxID=103775 RepID=UPI0022E65199|nr:fibroleukin [Drosophila gunungcola]
MKPENLNNLSQKPRGSLDDSTTENNSVSSGSDIEDMSGGTSDQKRIVQGLKKTIKRNKTKINELVAKLTISEMQLASEKEKSNHKDSLIKSLHFSIDLVNQTKELSIQKTQNQILDLQNALDLRKSNSIEPNDQITIDKLNAKIEKLECMVQEKDDKCVELEEKTQKYENDLQERDEQIARLEAELKTYEVKLKEKDDKLAMFSITTVRGHENSEPHVLLNCTKVSSIKFVTPHNFLEPFAALFEDIPSAGPDWMVIQRRVDGSVDFNKRVGSFWEGFGDLSREFWIGCEKLHKLTSGRRHELYVQLVDFDDATAFARYDHFVIGSRDEQYKLLCLGAYSGNAGDYMRKLS